MKEYPRGEAPQGRYEGDGDQRYQDNPQVYEGGEALQRCEGREAPQRKYEDNRLRLDPLWYRKVALMLSYRYLAEKFGAEVTHLHTMVDYIIRKTGTPLGSVLFSLKYIDRYMSSGTVEHPPPKCACGAPAAAAPGGLAPLEIVVAAFVLANKFLEDSYYSNKFWSETLRIPLPLMNSIELEFLEAISFRLHMSDTEFLDWCHVFAKHASSDLIDTQKIYNVITKLPGTTAPGLKRIRSDRPQAPVAPKTLALCAFCSARCGPFPSSKCACSCSAAHPYSRVRQSTIHGPAHSTAPRQIHQPCLHDHLSCGRCVNPPSNPFATNKQRLVRPTKVPAVPPNIGPSFAAGPRIEPLCVNPIS